MLLAPLPGDTGITINNVTTTGGRHEAQHFRSAHQEIGIQLPRTPLLRGPGPGLKNSLSKSPLILAISDEDFPLRGVVGALARMHPAPMASRTNKRSARSVLLMETTMVRRCPRCSAQRVTLPSPSTRQQFARHVSYPETKKKRGIRLDSPLALVEAAGQLIHGFRRGLDYAFILLPGCGACYSSRAPDES
jgi:hypothetical protein